VTSQSKIDRALGAYPLLLAYLVLLIVYAFQTTKHVTPWNYTDELNWALLSRGVAHHGVAYLRFARAPFSSLYAYAIAPAWWAAGTPSGYSVAKYINAAVMTASLFPAYALARLFVPKWPAIACGIATAAIPALAYTGILIPETLAYPWACLVLWLVARALLRRDRGAIAIAVVALAVSPAVRSELSVLLVAAAIALGVFAGTSLRGRSVVRSWTWAERVGVAILALGVLIWIGAAGNHHSYSWQIGTHFHHRMFTYGLWAIGAFTIGVGVLPVLVSLAWLLGNRFRDERDRVLGGVLIGTVVAFGLYTAVKASYISTNFAIRVEERDVIYMAPVVFVAAMRFAFAARTRILPLALAALGVWYLLDTTPYHNTEHFYSDAPGLSLLQWLNQKVYFSTNDARRLLFGILIGSVVVLVLREQPRLRRALYPAGAILAVAVIGWNLWGEVAAAQASNSFSRTIVGLPKPPDWVDETTGHQKAMFIGQGLGGSQAFWSLEFWNQSLQFIWSVDASAPGPGPTRTPNFYGVDGAVDPPIDVKWVVAAPGVEPVGALKTTVGGLGLYRVSRPVRLADAYGGLSTDGANWMANAAWYYHFVSGPKRRGVMTIAFSRTAACGPAPSSTITIKVSRLRVTPEPQAQPVAGKTLVVRHVVVKSSPCTTNLVVHIPVRTPFRVDLTANRTFEASPTDLRQLSAQVTAFKFSAR
jgi:hypothetical protein